MKKAFKVITNLLCAAVVLGFCIGLLAALPSLVVIAGHPGLTVHSVLLPLRRSVNTCVLYAVAFLLCTGASFALGRLLAALLRKGRTGTPNTGIVNGVTAFTVSLAAVSLLFRLRHRVVRLYRAALPEGLTQAFRLPYAAMLFTFLIVFLLLFTALRKLDYGSLARRAAAGAGGRPLKWICAACLSLMAFLTISDTLVRSRMPDVILVTVDTLRQDHLGYFSYRRNTSRNLDRFCKDGVVFLQSTSFSDWTMPSHENLLTGRYPASAVLKRVPLSMELLPEILKRRGYTTAAFVSGEWCKGRYGLNQGFDFYSDRFPGAERRIEEYYQSVIDWLDGRARSPFFLWLHLFEPHFPYAEHRDHAFGPARPTRFDEYNRYFGDTEEMLRLWQNKIHLGKKDIRRARALYDGEIAYVDAYLGRLWDDLKKRGIFNNSMIIVTSDHGEGFGEKRVYCHHGYNVTEELTRVPLVVKLPGNAHADKVIERQVQTSDIFATILDTAGIPAQESKLSRSLLPLILNDGSPPRRYAYSHSNEVKNYSVRNESFKLIYRGTLQDYLLYDMKNDPYETVNIAGEKPEVYREMREELDRFRKSFTLFAAKQDGERRLEVDEETSKRLKALGYVH